MERSYRLLCGGTERHRSTRTPEASKQTERPETSDGALTIESPMLGTFYRAERPGAEPFVEVGTEVEPDTIVSSSR